MAKAALWNGTDAETRKRGERTELDTPVVHALNDADQVVGGSPPSVPQLTQESAAWGVRPQG